MELKQLSFVCCWRELRVRAYQRKGARIFAYRIVDMRWSGKITTKKPAVIKWTHGKEMRRSRLSRTNGKRRAVVAVRQDEGVVILFTRIHSSSTSSSFLLVFTGSVCACAMVVLLRKYFFSIFYCALLNLIRVLSLTSDFLQRDGCSHHWLQQQPTRGNVGSAQIKRGELLSFPSERFRFICSYFMRTFYNLPAIYSRLSRHPCCSLLH